MSKEAFVTAKKIQEPEDVEVTDVDVTLSLIHIYRGVISHCVRKSGA